MEMTTQEYSDLKKIWEERMKTATAQGEHSLKEIWEEIEDLKQEIIKSEEKKLLLMKILHDICFKHDEFKTQE